MDARAEVADLRGRMRDLELRVDKLEEVMLALLSTADFLQKAATLTAKLMEKMTMQAEGS